MSLIVFFGPYETNGLIKHKPERLHGLLSELNKLSYHIEVIPTKHLERLTIEMRHREIFRCNIKNLKYNMDYEDDPMAQKIVGVVQEAHSRIYNESNIPKYYVNRMGMRGVQNIQRGITAKDIFSPSIELINEIGTQKARQHRE
ncbi:UPF0728 protein C10orf53 homolog [Harmonia axyridis]|uniref:UPF0728 protein C10orf53 homolog n=1 Tax=Harmonia axyridis TaxID=115357 RepID=UPI001E2754E3|nr:UPF0728 protein C10orf53 homolog [Harmonia axyridis]